MDILEDKNQIISNIQQKNPDDNDLEDYNTNSPNKEYIENAVYPTKVNFSKATPSIFDLHRKYTERKSIILTPDFQRDNVWTKKQKSELVESILMGIPIPLMYFFQNEKGEILVVDGKQRLKALFDFKDNKFRLSELSILSELKGKNFNDLTPLEKTNIEDYELNVYIIKPPTHDRIKFDIFDRVNRGGTRLNNQEMRNAIYQGYSTELLNKLSKMDFFKKATDFSIQTNRMKDKYIILRAISFIMLNNNEINFNEKYSSDIDDFLGKSMKFLNENSDYLGIIEEIFTKSLKNCYNILGKDGFRLSYYKKDNDKKSPVNMVLFEIFVYLMSHDYVNINNKKTKSLIINLFENEDFLDSITTPVDSSIKVIKRFEYMNKILKELNND